MHKRSLRLSLLLLLAIEWEDSFALAFGMNALFLSQHSVHSSFRCTTECEEFLFFAGNRRTITRISQTFLLGTDSSVDNESAPSFINKEQSSSSSSSSVTPSSPLPPPGLSLNGQRILPTKILLGGFQGQSSSPIPAVYAILNQNFKRGTDGWNSVEHVGVTNDLVETIQLHVLEAATAADSTTTAMETTVNRVAHIRALSFTYPDPVAMQTVARNWREQAITAQSPLDQIVWSRNALEYIDGDDNDDFDDDDDNQWRIETSTQDVISELSTSPSSHTLTDDDSPPVVVSPFATSAVDVEEEAFNNDAGRLSLTMENIDTVLNEVRPYLISDGGNITVTRINEEKKVVYLQLLGACGSCPSSTVTMKKGIERILNEHFDIAQILQEEDVGEDMDDNDDEGNPHELTWKAVAREVNRIRPAILAMGGICELVNVDSSTGVVQLKFRGFNKVQQGLELAIRDLPLVNAVQFVSSDA